MALSVPATDWITGHGTITHLGITNYHHLSSQSIAIPQEAITLPTQPFTTHHRSFRTDKAYLLTLPGLADIQISFTLESFSNSPPHSSDHSLLAKVARFGVAWSRLVDKNSGIKDLPEFVMLYLDFPIEFGFLWKRTGNGTVVWQVLTLTGVGREACHQNSSMFKKLYAQEQKANAKPAPGQVMVDLGKHFRTLGLLPGASTTEIRKAYRKAALRWHPDRQRKGGMSERAWERTMKEALVRTQELNEAHEVLTRGTPSLTLPIPKSPKKH